MKLATYSESETIDYLARGGDVLAEALSHVVVAMIQEDGDELERLAPPLMRMITHWVDLKSELVPSDRD